MFVLVCVYVNYAYYYLCVCMFTFDLYDSYVYVHDCWLGQALEDIVFTGDLWEELGRITRRS